MNIQTLLLPLIMAAIINGTPLLFGTVAGNFSVY